MLYYIPDIDFTNEFYKIKGMSSVNALNARVSLAYQYSENAQYICNCIEILINDQHMIHQG